MGALLAADELVPPDSAGVGTKSRLQKRVEAALATLPGTYREALLLVALEGLTPAEAAAVCGVTPETMRQRLSRARALLAKRLNGPAASSVTVLREVLP